MDFLGAALGISTCITTLRKIEKYMYVFKVALSDLFISFLSDIY